MRKILFLLFSLAAVSCTTEIDHRGKTPIAMADDVFLYKEDIESVVPPGITGQDSVKFVDDYIRKWAEDIVFYNKAKSNLSNEKEIERYVENYRRTLILNEYQERLVREKLEASISDEEVRRYYDEDKSLFVLDNPMIKGVYMKVALNNKDLKVIRRYMNFRNMHNVLRRALPGGLTNIVLIVGLELFTYAFTFQRATLSTLSTVTIGAVGLLVIYYVARPLDKKRWALLGAMTVAMVVAVVWFGPFFELTALDLQSALVVTVFLLLTPSVIYAFETAFEWGSRIKGEWLKRRKQRAKTEQ